MNWRVKAAVQQVFTWLPLGEQLNYFGQRYVIRSLPLRTRPFSDKVCFASRNFDAFHKHCSTGVLAGRAVFYEFGAGWDLVIPLAYYVLGAGSQVVIDNRSIARLDLVNDALARFKREDLRFPLPSDRREAAPVGIRSLGELEQRLGISYRAPCDARATGLAPGSIDFISSTATLEHIPASEIPRVFGECYRVLKSGGVMASIIDYADHYAYLDPSITPYNFLKYSDRAWRPYNPGIQYQNRLRHSDFLSMARAAGFDLVENNPRKPTDEDFEMLRSLKLDGEFTARYSLDELAIRNAFIVLKKV